MASVLQTLFALPTFQSRYYNPSAKQNTTSHAEECTVPLPADCVECQMRKIADGLLSGRWAVPDPNASQVHLGALPTVLGESMDVDKVEKEEGKAVEEVAFQAGIKPAGFKSLIGKGHAEFSTMKQQDSEEFFGHLLQVLRRDAHANKRDGDGAYAPLCSPISER